MDCIHLHSAIWVTTSVFIIVSYYVHFYLNQLWYNLSAVFP